MAAPTPSPPPDLGLVDGLVILSDLVQTDFTRTAADHQLTPLQARLLGMLRDRRPTMAELGQLMRLDPSSITGLVSRTQKRGLLVRVTDPDDHRSYRVELTSHGRRSAVAFVAAITSELRGLTSFLSEDDRGHLARLVSELVTTNADAIGLDLSTELTSDGNGDSVV